MHRAPEWYRILMSALSASKQINSMLYHSARSTRRAHLGGDFASCFVLGADAGSSLSASMESEYLADVPKLSLQLNLPLTLLIPDRYNH